METKKEKNTKEVYEAPVMEAVEVVVEQGFQASGATQSPPNFLKEQIW